MIFLFFFINIISMNIECSSMVTRGPFDPPIIDPGLILDE
jgi:hypothetical protein